MPLLALAFSTLTNFNSNTTNRLCTLIIHEWPWHPPGATRYINGCRKRQKAPNLHALKVRCCTCSDQYGWITDPTPDADHLPPVNPIKHFDSIPADLETLNAAQDPTTGKRTRGEDREEAMEQHGPKKTRNEYERRPRYKTREDRYDYKPNGPHSKEQSRKGKAKRLRRGRKETMNDGFHASNVARERLTVSLMSWDYHDSLTKFQLRKNTNVGIFNKGKASSPIKNRDGK